MDPAVIHKQVVPLKRRMEGALTEIRKINEQGRLAVKNPLHVDEFKGMFRAMERYFTRFEALWEEIADLYHDAKSTDFPTAAETSSKTNATRYYYEASTNFEIVSSPKTQPTPAEASVLNETALQRNRLPTIQVPQFYGEITQWPKFRDIYLSLVHNDASLTDGLKFQYLKSALKGPASSIIACFSIEDDEHYALAWRAVNNAYNNKRMLASAYLNQVLTFKPMQGKATVESLKQFRARISDSIAAFRLLRIKNESDFILFHLASKMLDSSLREQFEVSHKEEEFPSFASLDRFVNDRCLALQLVSGADSITLPSSSGEPSTAVRRSSRLMAKHSRPDRSCLVASGVGEQRSSPRKSSSGSSHPFPPCPCCKNGTRHHLLSCPRFCDAAAKDRVEMLRGWDGCVNCLSAGHKLDSCMSKWSCRFCDVRHHSNLHVFSSRELTGGPSTSTASRRGKNTPSSGVCCYGTAADEDPNVVLGTVIAMMEDARGMMQSVRVLVDPGSQYTFVSKKCLEKLGLDFERLAKRYLGIGDSIFDGAKGKKLIKLRPKLSDSIELVTHAVVVTTITSYKPCIPIPEELRKLYEDYTLADPQFWQPRPIEVLVGADLFTEIETGPMIPFGAGLPRLWPSIFGHIVIGRYDDAPPGVPTALLSLSEPDDIGCDLRRFWEIEEPMPRPQPLSPEDQKCEEHFLRTHYRQPNGRYVVCLPFKEETPAFGDSSFVALRRLKNLERKLERNPLIKEKYVQFMDEYETLGHMEVTSVPSKFLIPHHCVLKEAQGEAKIRVVYDGSVQVSPSSLNEQLMTGEKLQKDIRDILLRFRRHRYVFITDLVKMFRGIGVDEADWPYQHILWRSNSTDAVKTYALKTVTYGLSCSPWLALRVLKQIGVDEGHKFPLANEALSHDIYVDDWVTGADSVEQITELQQQVVALMKCGGFTLSKWASNCSEVLQAINDQAENSPVSLSSKEDNTVKILGLKWDPVEDYFFYQIKPPDLIYTKRAILSTVARLFDPLGFLTPVTLRLKAFIQELWKEGLGWDQRIPDSLRESWKTSMEELPCIAEIRIPRFVYTTGEYCYQIFGFSDASTKGYCAAIYIRIETTSGVQVQLLTAKSKLAPTKVITVPRLELCGALLLHRLYQSIGAFLDTLQGSGEDPLFFTDSSIVLSWLATPSCRLKTFVANRVAEIAESQPISRWRHVVSEENPADAGSRGLLPAELQHHTLWWHGPAWLTAPHEEWPAHPVDQPEDIPELKGPSVLLVTECSNPLLSWMATFSSYSRLVRSVAWLNRWRYNITQADKRSGPLGLKEVNSATTTCIKLIQRHYFFNGREIPEVLPENFYPQLAPYADSTGVVRVGGRLALSRLPENWKHPILLPPQSHFATLLVDHLHRVYLHPGPTQLQALLQTRYWIPSARRLIRQRNFMCISCYKAKGKVLLPKMGSLPSCRFSEGRAFSHVGVDFAGPFVVRDSLRRKAQTCKAYLAVYVCMATKAVHLEAVSRLTTEAFLASFHRFASRRGLPGDVYSDCGTNFVGADRHLKELYLWQRETSTQTDIANYATGVGVSWHFNPPLTPHMGGLWEAGVRSVKKRLQVIAGATPLSFEELTTLFSQIEAALNSRPLCPISDSPEETAYLTPGHFLVGGILQAVPEPSVLDVRENRLNRWQLIQKMSQQFWTRWRLEYLSTLQSRLKWQRKVPNLEVGDLVLLKEDAPPLQWPLARITAVHPGADNVVRVVTVRTTSGSSYKRPTVRCAPLLPLKDPPYPTSTSI